MNLTPIRDLVQKTRQLDPKKLGRASFVYVDISSVDKDTKRIVEPQTLSVADAPSRARKEIQTNDVLVATVRPNLNGVAIVPPEYNNQIASTGFCVLRPDTEQLNPLYLFYFTQTDYFISHLTELSTGAGYPAVSDDDILDTRIPLPPLEEQKRIASLLARADRLRGLRRAARRLADSLLQSVFLEMFGDGFGKWKVDLLENLTDKIDYGVTASAVLKPVGPKFLRITDIQEGKVNWDDVPYCEISEKERNASLLSKGDIVFARTGATTGKSFLIQECPENSVFASYLIRVRPAKELNPVFLFGYFQTAQYWKQISESATGSTQPGVNSTKLGELKIPLPPLPLQEEFARVAARVEALRARQAEAERQAEHLFESLLAESFAG